MLIRSLEIFRAVVDTGSFSAAAERLHTVQSNVTAHVKKLETELDARLLERRNPVVATPAGRQLLAYARRIVELHDDALSRFRPGGEPLGELRLGSMETTAAVHLPRLLTDFSRRWPQLGVHLHTGTTGELIEEVRGGRLDAAFVVAEDAGDDLALRPVFRERLVLVSGRPLESFPGRADLARMPFLAFRSGCGYRTTIEVLLADLKVAAPRIHEFGSLDAIVGCVGAGMGLALLPASTVDQYRRRHTLHTLDLPGDRGRVTTMIATLKQASWSRALEVFMEGVPGPAGDVEAPGVRAAETELDRAEG
ncbi:LysR substrate-binding domain-containing protein [Alloalcanivorax profundimaris]|uniref:LysR family transcriptional regulator n=1 Tax=Alloalcanivorax profundimaris TaxID=2735259 RepID=A0ABS0AUM3_9GAMM|nr:LysR substrate-binding domain-containing protein [Alloalcanivorax profundimaris]MBF1803005.1 LysR family transcriptional regulator [Alloalcanivorax profundimaris]MBF5056995.1 LysR family transcriptional regulator [Alloalcanivorax profundimaris]